MKVFSGTTHKALALLVADELALSLSPLDFHVFPDGEKRVRILEKVLDEECIVVQSTGIPVDENYMELFFIIDGLKRSGAKTVTLVIPYMGYQRQDHVFRIGEARSFAVIAKILETLGVDKLITFDLHTIKIPELFQIPVTHLSALPLFADEIRKRGWQTQDTVLVSPDMGGIRRLEILSGLLDGMLMAKIEKERNLETGEIALAKIHGTVRPRAIIVDDMISTGRTIIKAMELLVKNGVENISVFAIHPELASNASELLQNKALEVVYITDTIELPKEKKFPNLKILSVSKIIAKAIFEDNE